MLRAQFARYINPVLAALRELGGSGRPSEVVPVVVRDLAIPDEELEERNQGGQSKVENQIAWARFYLVKDGFIDSSKRGVWALTEKGRKSNELTTEELNDLVTRVQVTSAAVTKSTNETGESKVIDASAEVASEEDSPDLDDNYRERLLALLKALPPDGFERLCQRMLREAGFEQVTVTGRAGDGGIDGIGLLQVNPFVTFKVLFQCKRYDKTVGPSTVRDFRGAMQGRTDKGIIITTGTYTTDAKKEAVREGVPPIELVDGERMIEMFENLELGLRPRTTYDVDEQFFKEFQ